MSNEFGQLLQAAGSNLPQLLIIDENSGNIPRPANGASMAMGNRLDVCKAVAKTGWATSFSDFVFSAIEGDYHQILYRLSKEKRVVEHVLDQAWARLEPGGELWLAGYKNEGVKTFAKRAARAWQCEVQLQRGKSQLHLYCFGKEDDQAEKLSNEDYALIRQIKEWQGLPLYSKPGIFAWNRIDEGSAFLLQHLNQFLPADCEDKQGLDLGCGYGLLALAMLKNNFGHVSATDNNAAALLAAEHTLKASCGEAQTYDVVAADCGDSLNKKFDVILSNPPFHQGFGVEQNLTDLFLKETRRLLRKKGRALFVVNAFIPLEKKAKGQFSEIELLAENRSYKLVVLS